MSYLFPKRVEFFFLLERKQKRQKIKITNIIICFTFLITLFLSSHFPLLRVYFFVYSLIILIVSSQNDLVKPSQKIVRCSFLCCLLFVVFHLCFAFFLCEEMFSAIKSSYFIFCFLFTNPKITSRLPIVLASSVFHCICFRSLFVCVGFSFLPK